MGGRCVVNEGMRLSMAGCSAESKEGQVAMTNTYSKESQ